VSTTVARVAEVTDAQQLQPIRLYAAELVLVASVSPGEERVTDILNRGGDLRVLPAGASAEDPVNWLSVTIDDVGIVVPPDHVSPPHKRVVREKHVIRLRVVGWDVVGTAHLKAGAEQDAFLISTQPFLPLTNATITSLDHPFPQVFDVVIVNLRHAEVVTD
jgi:hypothetical protein